MKFMRIPNAALVALACAWVALAWIAFPWQVWLFGLPLMVVAYLLAGVLYASGAFGAGDLKMAAAMSPWFIGADPAPVMRLVCACLIGALVAHRLLRATPFRAAAGDWSSWTHPKFPMGLALSGVLIFHPVLAAISS
jgi:prepilin peptidase CpaA